MTTSIYINMVCEDVLSEAVLRKIIAFTDRPYCIKRVYGNEGFGFIKKNIRGFHAASKVTPYLVLTDLDTDECAPSKIQSWLGTPPHQNLLFRIAVKEVEAWLLADARGIASFFGIPITKVPSRVEDIPDPKQTLINLARRSIKRVIKEDIVPYPESSAPQGRNYNGRMKEFVGSFWDINAAMPHSNSLARTFSRLKEFKPR